MTFDPLVANPGRLKILAALVRESQQPFVQLRNQTGLTDGNLATHARRLKAAGFVGIEKTISRGKPLTTVHLTRQGREALASHVQSLVDALSVSTRVAEAVASVEDEDTDWVD